MTEAEELELLELEEEEARAAQAKRTFTGKEERAAEERKLLESMSVPERLLAGLGKGFYDTHLNVSDLMGRLPGLQRVDPQWRQQEEEVSRPLIADAFGQLGNLTGATAALAPVGAGAGAVMRTATAALPGGLAAASPLLTMGAEGAAQGAVASPERPGEGALTGLKFALGLGGAAKTLGALGGRSGAKADAILAAQLEKARAAKAAEIKKAAGELGAATQKGSRLEEQFSRYVDDPSIPAELRDAIAKWKASPRSQELLSDVLTNQLNDAPTVSGTIAGKQMTLRQLTEGAEDEARQLAAQAVSPAAALQKLKGRAIRIGSPALLGLLGQHLFGPMGGAMGLAGGAVLRPMMHSLKRLAKDPAVQTSLLRGAEGFGSGVSSLADLIALGNTPALQLSFPAPTRSAVPAFAGQANQGDTRLADLLLPDRQARR